MGHKPLEIVNKIMFPTEADKYAREIVDKEIPKGMKCYLELELLPWVHLKVGKGILLTTSHNWMHCNGFQYQTYEKAVYFDGHECSDVVEYCQNVFLPTMAHHHLHLVEYDIGNISIKKSRSHYILEQRRLCFLLMMNPQCRLMMRRPDGDLKVNSQH